MNSFQNKVYVVTGLGGIGLAVAKQLHAQGAHLSLADISPKTLTSAIEAITSMASTRANDSPKPEIMTTVVDIGSSKAVNDWIASTLSRFGRLDGAANMAGAIGPKHGIGRFIDQEDDEWDMLVRVNLSGMMYCLRAELRAILSCKPEGEGESEGKGSIVNASSIQGIRGFPLHAAYSTTKHGVVGLTRSVAKEVGPGIRVNAVAPGSIQTPLLDQGAAIQGVAASTPSCVIPRVGTAEEVAQTVVFLLSDASSYTTGQVYSVDGGWDP